MRHSTIILVFVMAALGACKESSRRTALQNPSAPVANEVDPASTLKEEVAPTPNPVQNEMRLLNAAMQRSLTLLANGDLKDIPPAIFSVHGARDLTEKAIHAGSYKPPANSDDIAGFVATDRAFHDQLVQLVQAAKRGDRKAATAAYAEVVIGCTHCHQRYREGF